MTNDARKKAIDRGAFPPRMRRWRRYYDHHHALPTTIFLSIFFAGRIRATVVASSSSLSSSSSRATATDPIEFYKPCGIEDKIYAREALQGGENVDRYSPDPLRGGIVVRDFCFDDGEYVSRGFMNADNESNGRVVLEDWCWVRICTKEEAMMMRISEWEIRLD